jgi:hypothetical protein
MAYQHKMLRHEAYDMAFTMSTESVARSTILGPQRDENLVPMHDDTISCTCCLRYHKHTPPHHVTHPITTSGPHHTLYPAYMA